MTKKWIQQTIKDKTTDCVENIVEQLNQIIEKLRIEIGLKDKYIEELEAKVLLHKRKKMACTFSPGNCL